MLPSVHLLSLWVIQGIKMAALQTFRGANHMSDRINDIGVKSIPNWVSPYAMRYLIHTEKGVSIRELARHSKCHASTISRQIRRIESRRDDPLFDAALTSLSAQVSAAKRPLKSSERKTLASNSSPATDQNLETSSLEILTGLTHAGAVLAVAKDMEKAVVMREGLNGQSERTVIADRSIAEAMVLKDWITCKASGRVSRYVITPKGRAVLAKAQSTALPLADKDSDASASDGLTRVKFHASEGPMALLARRKNKDGSPFLAKDLVQAGERLREDFELAHLEPGLAQNWDGFLTPKSTAPQGSNTATAARDARARVSAALEDLGEGLADIALRCCCHLEGLEISEKRLGWPARSGKVVLKIALSKLALHYRGCDPKVGDMIW